MNKKFVQPMILKYNTAQSVHAKLSNLEDLSLIVTAARKS